MTWVSRFNAARRLLDPLKSENSTVRVPGTSIGPRKASVEVLSGRAISYGIPPWAGTAMRIRELGLAEGAVW
jgi:hypothetical protein